MVTASCLLIVFVLAGFYADIRTHKLPNTLTLSGVALGLANGFLTPALQSGNAASGGRFFAEGWQGLLASAQGMAVGFAIMFVLYLFGALGAGDVKLFAAIGAFMGAPFAIESSICSILYAGAIGLSILIGKKLLFARLGSVIFGIIGFVGWRDTTVLRMKKSEMLRFPFMYAVLPAVLTLLARQGGWWA